MELWRRNSNSRCKLILLDGVRLQINLTDQLKI